MSKRNIGIAILAMLLLAAAYGAGCGSNRTITKTIVKKDTAYITVPSDPIVIYRTKTKVKYLKGDTVRDTIYYKTPAFVATLDTITGGDTISAKYEFPEHLLSLMVRQKPDSIKTVTIEIETTKTEIDSGPWWKAPAIGLGGAFLGYLVGSVSK